MRSNKSNTSFFDDDFEVTYEEDLSIHSEFDFNTTKLPDNQPKKKAASKKSNGSKNNSSKAASQKPDLSIPLSAKKQQEKLAPIKTDIYRQKNTDTRFSRQTRPTSTSNTSSRTANRPAKSTASQATYGTQRRRKNSPARLAAPLQEGQDALFNISKSFLRNLSAFLILAIIVLLLYDFFRGSALYGDIEDAVSTQTYTQVLSAYIAVAASLVLFEVLSLLWTMTKPRVRAEYGYRREDVGRGQFSFIFIYLLSYTAFLLSKYIPELNDALKGIKGALDVFGSLHNALFGLCLAGVISCIVRKHNPIL